MNGKQLEYFATIADLGSFRRASEELRIAQPALTRQIKKLEDELGVELLNRGGRTITLTNAGTTLLDRARFILRQIEQAKADVIAEGTVPTGIVGFGAPASIAQILFSNVAKSYLGQYPQVGLRFFEGVGHLWKWLQAGEIDLAILPDTGLLAGGNLGSHKFVSEPVYLVGPPEDPTLQTGCLSDELFARPLILAKPPSAVRAWLDATVSKAGRQPTIVAEAEGVQIQKDLVRAGLGYALLPHSAVYRDYEAGLLTLSRVREWKLGRILAWRIDRPLTPAAREMVRVVRIEMQKLKQQGAFGAPDRD
ncbi:LysR family transcriptional regulator [Pseudochelatococcus sp. B33]